MIKFGLVGMGNTLLFFFVYYILRNFRIHRLFIYPSSFIICMLNAFWWNYKFVFKNSSNKNAGIFLRMICCYGATFLLGNASFYIMTKHTFIPEYIVIIINISITVPVNYFMNKFWTFRNSLKTN